MSENWDSWTPKSGPIEGRKDSGRVPWCWRMKQALMMKSSYHMFLLFTSYLCETTIHPPATGRKNPGLSGFSDRTNSTATFGCSGATWTAIAGRAAGAVGTFVATSYAPISGGEKRVFFQVKLPLSISGLLSWFLPQKISGIWPQDSSSSIADFYPREFQLDLKPGDKDWQVPWGWWVFMVFLPIVVWKSFSQTKLSPWIRLPRGNFCFVIFHQAS